MARFLATRDILEVQIPPGGRIKCESDAIVTSGSNSVIDASMDGGFLGALARTALTGKVSAAILEFRCVLNTIGHASFLMHSADQL